MRTTQGGKQEKEGNFGSGTSRPHREGGPYTDAKREGRLLRGSGLMRSEERLGKRSPREMLRKASSGIGDTLGQKEGSHSKEGDGKQQT